MHVLPSRRPSFYVTALLLCVFLAGCGSKLTQANFDRIKTDMTMDQVQDILGKPSESSSIQVGSLSGTSAVWRDKSGSISIKFVNGKVQLKNFEKH